MNQTLKNESQNTLSFFYKSPNPIHQSHSQSQPLNCKIKNFILTPDKCYKNLKKTHLTLNKTPPKSRNSTKKLLQDINNSNNQAPIIRQNRAKTQYLQQKHITLSKNIYPKISNINYYHNNNKMENNDEGKNDNNILKIKSLSNIINSPYKRKA